MCQKEPRASVCTALSIQHFTNFYPPIHSRLHPQHTLTQPFCIHISIHLLIHPPFKCLSILPPLILSSSSLHSSIQAPIHPSTTLPSTYPSLFGLLVFPSLPPSVLLSCHPSFHLSTHQVKHHLSISPPINSSISPSIYPPPHPPIHRHIHVSLYISIHPSRKCLFNRWLLCPSLRWLSLEPGETRLIRFMFICCSRKANCGVCKQPFDGRGVT